MCLTHNDSFPIFLSTKREFLSIKYQNASILGTLATAYALAGKFDRAVATAQTALALASAYKADKLAQYIRKQLDRYKKAKQK